MKKENDELFDLFRTRLEHAEVEVRDNFWAQLEQDIPVVQRNRRRIIFQRFSAAASVLLILAFVSAAFWHFSPKDEIADAFSKVETTTTTKGTIKNDAIKQELPSIHTAQVNPARTVKTPSAQLEPEEIEEDSFTFTMTYSITERIIENRNNTNHPNRMAGGMDVTGYYPEEEQKENVAAVSSEETKKHPWSMGLFASANLITGKESRGGEMLKHKLPLSIGLTVRKDLSDRFSLETGLVYTQLNSKITGAKDDTYYKQDQTLHYLGIPIKANLSLYENKHIDLYASAGGMIEKSVSGKIKTDFYDAGKHTHSSKHSLKVDPLQLSAMASLGLQYKINEQLSVYAEPGLSYHFDDGSPVSTIRKEKPLNFNLLCGVRMTY